MEIESDGLASETDHFGGLGSNISFSILIKKKYTNSVEVPSLITKGIATDN